MANNEVDVFFEKGTPLPAKSKMHSHRTVVAIRRCSTDGKIKIPIVEGDRIEAADLNLRIGEFTVDLVDINRDVPLGSELKSSWKLDSSRLLKGSIYIPLLDREFPLKIDLVRRNQM
jgi:hypothetical protein